MNTPVRMLNPTVTATLWYNLCLAHLLNTDTGSPMTNSQKPIRNNAVKAFTRNPCLGRMKCEISMYEIAVTSTTLPTNNYNSSYKRFNCSHNVSLLVNVSACMDEPS